MTQPDIIYIIRHGEKPANSLAAAPGQAPPPAFPPFGVDFQGNQDPHRFDVIWTFTLVPGASPAQYTFGQIPQQVLSGTPTVIAAPADPGSLP